MKKLAGIGILVAALALLFHPVVALTSPTEAFAETSQLQVQAGKEFTITLQSNRSTGYQWKLAKPLDKAVVKMMSSQYILPSKPIPGAGGEEVWVFKAVARGETQIHMEYVRPWEKGQAPARTATYSIVVK